MDYGVDDSVLVYYYLFVFEYFWNELYIIFEFLYYFDFVFEIVFLFFYFCLDGCWCRSWYNSWNVFVFFYILF